MNITHPEIVVGLVATPPDYPARVAAQLSAELADRLAERVDADVRWTVREGWGDVAPRRDGGAEALLDDLARRRTDDGWDVAVCLTDLPLHTDRVPLVAQTSARRRVALVSLPALGLRQLPAVRAVVPDLVGRLLTDASDERVPPAGREPAELASRVTAVHRVLGEGRRRGAALCRLAADRPGAAADRNGPGQPSRARPAGPVQAAGRRVRHRRVRAHHQHHLADGRRPRPPAPHGDHAARADRAGGLADHRARPVGEAGPRHSAELARMFNLGTTLTLTLATAVSYLVLFAGTALAAALLIDTSVLEQTLQRPAHTTDYLTLAWIISSLATVGGAIGSGLEDEETVRAAAYGYHPEPDGWRRTRTVDAPPVLVGARRARAVVEGQGGRQP